MIAKVADLLCLLRSLFPQEKAEQEECALQAGAGLPGGSNALAQTAEQGGKEEQATGGGWQQPCRHHCCSPWFGLEPCSSRRRPMALSLRRYSSHPNFIRASPDQLFPSEERDRPGNGRGRRVSHPSLVYWIPQQEKAY